MGKSQRCVVRYGKKTLDSVLMAIATGSERNHPVSAYGENVILLGNNSEYTKLVYTKGTPEHPVITRIYSGESLALKEAEELEGIRSRNVYRSIGELEKYGLFEVHRARDYPSYSESEGRGPGSERTGFGNLKNTDSETEALKRILDL